MKPKTCLSPFSLNRTIVRGLLWAYAEIEAQECAKACRDAHKSLACLNQAGQIA